MNQDQARERAINQEAPKMIEYGNGMRLPLEQFIILAGDHNPVPSGPYPSEEAAHVAYKTNQPTGLAYLSPPTIVRLLRPLERELGGRVDLVSQKKEGT